MGQESHCEMVALKDKDPDRKHCVYSGCSVLKATPDLPDGPYTVSFDGCTVAVFRECGLWLANGEMLPNAS
jgi:hypothetical protein